LCSVGDSSDRPAGAAHHVGVVVQLQIRERQHRRGLPPSGAPQQRLDARDHLLEAERLRHVVVAAQRQAPHRLLGAVARGEEQHRRVVALAPQPPAHLETVDVGQHDVEQQEVRRVRAHGDRALRPSPATSTAKPKWRSAVRRRNLMFSSSSTTRTRAGAGSAVAVMGRACLRNL